MAEESTDVASMCDIPDLSLIKILKCATNNFDFLRLRLVCHRWNDRLVNGLQLRLHCVHFGRSADPAEYFLSYSDAYSNRDLKLRAGRLVLRNLKNSAFHNCVTSVLIHVRATGRAENLINLPPLIETIYDTVNPTCDLRIVAVDEVCTNDLTFIGGNLKRPLQLQFPDMRLTRFNVNAEWMTTDLIQMILKDNQVIREFGVIDVDEFWADFEEICVNSIDSLAILQERPATKYKIIGIGGGKPEIPWLQKVVNKLPKLKELSLRCSNFPLDLSPLLDVSKLKRLRLDCDIGTYYSGELFPLTPTPILLESVSDLQVIINAPVRFKIKKLELFSWLPNLTVVHLHTDNVSFIQGLAEVIDSGGLKLLEQLGIKFLALGHDEELFLRTLLNLFTEATGLLFEALSSHCDRLSDVSLLTDCGCPGNELVYEILGDFPKKLRNVELNVNLFCAEPNGSGDGEESTPLLQLSVDSNLADLLLSFLVGKIVHFRAVVVGIIPPMVKDIAIKVAKEIITKAEFAHLDDVTVRLRSQRGLQEAEIAWTEDFHERHLSLALMPPHLI